jgi:acyl dehydratase
MTRNAVTETAIRRYCEVAQDGNPVYWDEGFARTSRFGRLIAPPQSLFSMTFSAWCTPEHVQRRLDVDVAALNAGEQDAEDTGVYGFCERFGYTVNTVASQEIESGAVWPGRWAHQDALAHDPRNRGEAGARWSRGLRHQRSRVPYRWAGPEAFLRRLRFSIKGPNCLGDTITSRGWVTRRYEQNDQMLLDLEIHLDNQLQQDATIAKLTIELPG